MPKEENESKNLAFVFPPILSDRIRKIQGEMGAKSPGEVLVKAISLLELSLGRKVEIQGEHSKKWEIDQFENLKKTVNIVNNTDGS